MHHAPRPAADLIAVADLIRSARCDWQGLPTWARDIYEAGNMLILPRHVVITTPEGRITGDHDDSLVRDADGRLSLRKPDAARAERLRIKRLLSAPMLAALRCVPDGEIRNGCVIHDGATVRERLRQAWLAIDAEAKP